MTVNGAVVHDPEHPVQQDVDRVAVDGQACVPKGRLVVMLNKPRGLVTTARDEQGRDTVYRCFADADLPWLAPVGRLDQASEGLLLFTNDPAFAARITHPDTGTTKTYHVQVDVVPDAALLATIRAGADVDGERLTAVDVQLLRAGQRNAWLIVVLDEGRNRQIRRLFAAFGITVLRLVRVAIGTLPLGTLAKGQWRTLTDTEIDGL